MPKTLLAAAPLMLAFCNQPVAPQRASAPPRGGSVAPVASRRAQPAAPPFVLAHGVVDGARYDFALERRGDEAVGMWAAEGGPASPLSGQATGAGDDYRFVVSDGVRAEGRVEGGAVRALTVRRPGGNTPFVASIEAPPPADDFEQAYAGDMGGARVHLKLARRGDAVTGVWREALAPAETRFAGRATGAGFEIEDEAGVRLAGVFVGHAGVLGRWVSADGARSYDVALAAGSYPEAYAMTTRAGRVVPIEPWTALAPFCTESRTVPSLVGSDAAAVLDAALDRASRSLGTPLSKADCAGATESMPYERTVSYVVTGERPGFLGLTFSVYEFTGGAHGDHASRCVVADFARRDAVRLASDLSPRGRPKIARLAVPALEREHHVAKLTDAGFFEDSPALGDAELCFVTHEGASALRVEYPLYAIAPYVVGMPTAVLDASDVSGAFRAGTTGAALFP